VLVYVAVYELKMLLTIGHEANYRVALLNQPCEDAAGVETTAVRETDLCVPRQSVSMVQLKRNSRCHLFLAHVE
jgi:hypothetical protein